MNMNVLLTSNNNLPYSTNVLGLTLLERTIRLLILAEIRNIYIDFEIDEKTKSKLDKEYKKINIHKSNTNSPNEFKIEISSVFDLKYIQSSGKEGFFFLIKDKDDIKKAEQKILYNCRREDDGPITYVYRYLSLFISKHLCKTKITPNQITISSIPLTIISAISISLYDNYYYYIGLLLYFIVTILDSSDGEIARAKLIFSEFGAKLDTYSDNYIKILFFSSLIISNYRENSTNFNLYLGVSSILIYSLANFYSSFVSYYSSKHNIINNRRNNLMKKNLPTRILVDLVGKDTSATIFMVLAVLGYKEAIMIIGSAGSIVTIISVSLIFISYIKKRNKYKILETN